MKDEYRISYTRTAANDIKSIYRYIAFSLQEPETAGKTVEKIQAEINNLSFFPRKYRLSEYETEKPLHQMSVAKFVVFLFSR